jgi:hypothetical protein
VKGKRDYNARYAYPVTDLPPLMSVQRLIVELLDCWRPPAPPSPLVGNTPAESRDHSGHLPSYNDNVNDNNDDYNNR